MPERVQLPFLTHGISTQPAHLRRPDQVEDAENVIFDPSHGARRSAPVEFMARITGLSSGPIRLHPMVRDEDDRFIVILDNGTVRVFDSADGSEIPVTESDDADTYLNSGTLADDTLRPVSIADFTILLNTNVEAAVKRSDAYVVDEAHRDFDVMVTYTPEAGTYHRTEDDTAARTAGYYLYDPAPNGDATFATWESTTLGDGDGWGVPTGNWDNAAQNPGGIKITFKDGDGVNHDIEAEWDFSDDTPATMEDLALQLQQAIRDAGAVDACVSWNPSGTGNQGTLIVTAPYRGSGTQVVSIGTPDDGSLNDFSTLQPFDYSLGTATDGTGSAPSDQFPPLSRWTRVAAPDQPEAEPDGTTLPVAMRRLEAPIYADTVEDDGPHVYYRLGESSGTTATDERGVSDGTYVNSPTLGATGALAGDNDTAVTFASASNHYVNIGTLGGLGSQLDQGVTVEFWIKTTATSTQTVCQMNGANNGSSSGAQLLSVTVNNFVQGDIQLSLQEFGGAQSIRTTYLPGSVQINDGSYHHVVAQVDPDSKTGSIHVDGEDGGASTTADAGTIDDFYDYEEDGAIGAAVGAAGSVTPDLDGTLDEFAIYIGKLAETNIVRHYERGANALTFDIDLIEWNPRITGDELTNPAPELFTDGIRLADIAYHRNRLVLAGQERAIFSQSGDLFNFYIENDAEQVDSDPIKRTLSASKQVTFVDHMIPFRKGLTIFTRADQQFELNAPEALTPDTAAITPTTSYNTVGARPQQMGDRIYFAAEKLGNAQVLEYYQEEAVVRDTARDISEHVEGLIPSDIKTIAGSTNNRLVLLLPRDDHRLYPYSFMFQQRERLQSAWSRWALLDTDTVVDAVVIQDHVYLLIENDDGEHILCKQALSERTADTGMPYPVHLNLLQTVTGSLNGSHTDFEQGFDDGDIDTIVLGPDFGTPGDTRSVTRVDANTVRVENEDLTAGEVYLGRRYTSFVELTRPYPKARGGEADLDSTTWIREMVARHQDAGSYTITASKAKRSDRTASFDAGEASIDDRGRTRLYGIGEAEDVTLKVSTDDPRPMTLVSAEYIVDRVTRRARR